MSCFAAEVWIVDAGQVRDMGEVKRVASLACMLHTARTRGRDALATMYCKRLANIHKQARERFEAARESARAETEHLVDVFGDVLAAVQEVMEPTEVELADAAPAPADELWRRTGKAVLDTLIDGGGVSELAGAHERVSAFHGDNYLPFLHRHHRSSRSALFDLLDTLELIPTTADRTVLDAVEFLRAGRKRLGEHISDHLDGQRVDLSFASEAWTRILRDRRRPTRLVRRHFEACVFSYLAAELRSGDIAVVGSESYANLHEQLLSWSQCQPLLADYCAEVGLAAEAEGFVSALRARLTETAAGVDAGYSDNADLRFVDGQPVLQRRKGAARRASAIALEKTVLSRLPERGLLDVITRVAYWTGWPRHFGPASGSDPKIRDALGRYVLMTFCYGANLGPYQMARHMGGSVSAHQMARRSPTPAPIGSTPPGWMWSTPSPGWTCPACGGRGWPVRRGRRVPGGHVVGQSPGRGSHPVWGLRGDRVPPHRRQLHSVIYTFHSVWGVGSRLHH